MHQNFTRARTPVRSPVPYAPSPPYHDRHIHRGVVADRRERRHSDLRTGSGTPFLNQTFYFADARRIECGGMNGDIADRASWKRLLDALALGHGGPRHEL